MEQEIEIGRLTLSVNHGQTIVLSVDGEAICRVTLTGQASKAKLRFEAPLDIDIDREEIFERRTA